MRLMYAGAALEVLALIVPLVTRVVSAVFFGINTLDLLLSFGLVHAGATEIVGLIIWLVGLAAIILIFNKKATPFYTRQPAHE